MVKALVATTVLPSVLCTILSGSTSLGFPPKQTSIVVVSQLGSPVEAVRTSICTLTQIGVLLADARLYNISRYTLLLLGTTIRDAFVMLGALVLKTVQ